MKKIFLDTSFIIAYVNSNDEQNENALKLEEKENILKSQKNIFISNY